MPEAKRDRYGRYLLPNPETGKETAWTRATTLAETLEDQYGLTKWKMRNAIWGVAQRTDLLALAQSATLEDDKQLDELCEQGLVVAGSGARANMGTALHKFTERLDRGEKFVVPSEYAPDLEAYLQVKKLGRIQTAPAFVERILVVPEFNVAGTTDRIVRVDGEMVCIADLKTGGDVLKYSQGKIAIQLAVYAHATAMWNQVSGVYEAVPPVDQDRGLVIHVPAGEARADLYWVDLVQGWQAANLAYKVRQWRKNKKLLSKIDLENAALSSGKGAASGIHRGSDHRLRNSEGNRLHCMVVVAGLFTRTGCRVVLRDCAD